MVLTDGSDTVVKLLRRNAALNSHGHGACAYPMYILCTSFRPQMTEYVFYAQVY